MDKAVMFEMDDARREKFSRVASQIIDLLRKEFDTPVEAYALPRFVQNGLEETCDLKGTLIYEKDGVGHA